MKHRTNGALRDSTSDASQQYLIVNQGYTGKTYSVKYLGIVDGTMGILSRKMALVGAGEAAVPIAPTLDASADYMNK